MSNYSQNTFFTGKDNLSSGNPSKLVLGSEVDAELLEISTAISSKTEGDIPATTIMLFANTAAPSGWTLETGYDDRVLLGTDTAASGGGTGGNWTITGLTTNGLVPAHSHNVSLTTDNVTHNFLASDSGPVAVVGNAAHQHTASGVTGNLTANANLSLTSAHTPGWRPLYVKIIFCSKD